MIDFKKARFNVLKAKYKVLERKYAELKEDRDRMQATLQKIEEGIYCHADACNCGLGSPKEIARKCLRES